MAEDSGKPMENPQPTRKEQLLEVLVFLFLILPSLALSFFVAGQATGLSFLFLSGSVILRDLSLLCLVLFFVWRNGEHPRAVGLTAGNFWREVNIGIWLFIPLFLVTSALESYLHRAGLSAPPNPLPALIREKGTAEFLLAFFMVVIVALAEETIFRGYLTLRLKSVTSSPAAAVLLSTFIFTMGHGYEGSARVVTIYVIGLVFALVYLWRKSLIAPIVMHFLQDFIGIVLVPLMKQFNIPH